MRTGAYANYVRHHYGVFAIRCNDYDGLLQFMAHDKKNNTSDALTFTLLKKEGEPVTGVKVAPEDVKPALDIYCDLLM